MAYLEALLPFDVVHLLLLLQAAFVLLGHRSNLHIAPAAGYTKVQLLWSSGAPHITCTQQERCRNCALQLGQQLRLAHTARLALQHCCLMSIWLVQIVHSSTSLLRPPYLASTPLLDHRHLFVTSRLHVHQFPFVLSLQMCRSRGNRMKTVRHAGHVRQLRIKARAPAQDQRHSHGMQVTGAVRPGCSAGDA